MTKLRSLWKPRLGGLRIALGTNGLACGRKLWNFSGRLRRAEHRPVFCPSQVGVSTGPSRRGCPHLSPYTNQIVTLPLLHETPIQDLMVLSRLFWLEPFQLGSRHIHSPPFSLPATPPGLAHPRVLCFIITMASYVSPYPVHLPTPCPP